MLPKILLELLLSMDKSQVDIKLLIKPINESSAVGEDLRVNPDVSPVYYQAKDTRALARAAERKYLEENCQSAQKDIKVHWQSLHEQASNILEKYSKDLEVIAWLIEASVRLQGLTGLKQAFNLAEELIERYWPNIFPAEEDDEVFGKLYHLAVLNGVDVEGILQMPLNWISITDKNKTDEYFLWQYKQSLEVAATSTSKKKKKKLEERVVSLDKIKISAEASGIEFYKSLQKMLDEVLRAFKQLSKKIESKVEGIDFPISNICHQLNEAKDLVAYFQPEEAKQEISDEKENNVDSSQAEETKKETKQYFHRNKIFSNREEALEQLLVIADFFRETEPQSLLPYILVRANKWGKLALPDLLKEIVGDEKARENLFNLTGVN